MKRTRGLVEHTMSHFDPFLFVFSTVLHVRMTLGKKHRKLNMAIGSKNVLLVCSMFPSLRLTTPECYALSSSMLSVRANEGGLCGLTTMLSRKTGDGLWMTGAGTEIPMRRSGVHAMLFLVLFAS